MYRIVYVLSLFVFLVACKDDKKPNRLLADASGRINTVTVVMPKADWNGILGSSVRKQLEKEYEGLPLVEPQLTVTYLPPSLFDGFAKHSRNIILFSKDSIAQAQLIENLYAKPQRVAWIKGEDAEIQQFYFEENADLILRRITENERIEKMRRMRKSPANPKDFSQEFDVNMLYPSAYTTFKKDTNFVWIQKEISKGHLNLVMYVVDNQNMSANTGDKILNIRDSIGKKYIPGRLPDTYMATEAAYRPYFYKTKLDGKNTFITKGMWSVANDYMAGPFVHYLIQDTLKKRWLAVEGFAFAPSVNKREYMFELETMIQSVQFRTEKN